MRIGIRASLALVYLSSSVACSGGGTSSVPIDQIPPDTLLNQLTPPEEQGVCDYYTGLAKQKFAGAACNGNPITVNGCMGVGADCPATLAQYEACIPNFLDRLASDPCEILSLAFSQSDLEDYVDATPGCAGFGPCATAMP